MARSIAGGLRPHFSVHLTHNSDELRDNVLRTRPEAVVLNMELWQLADVETLRRDFPDLPIVCTHRIPDEEMWMAALSAGATDMCPVEEVSNVVKSLLRNSTSSRTAAA